GRKQQKQEAKTNCLFPSTPQSFLPSTIFVAKLFYCGLALTSVSFVSFVVTNCAGASHFQGMSRRSLI
ncbi:MAG TPA: hypothetical protein VJ808_10560, partial [Gemmatimonadales bacterium]|nr:hypothetical protein [Gemmatimonadales bacterium]